MGKRSTRSFHRQGHRGRWRQFRSLAEPWADTATSTGRLMIVADVERDLIRTRTAEGRSRAKARGMHMGRTPSLTPQQQAEARQRRAEGATLKDLARSYNVSMATISRLRTRAPALGPLGLLSGSDPVEAIEQENGVPVDDALRPVNSFHGA